MKAQSNSIITEAVLHSAMNYDQYMTLLTDLLAEGKTTGDKQSEAMVGYGKMNVQRMKRLNKTIQLLPELEDVVQGLTRKMTFLVITEGWCGDAAQNVPVFNKLTEHNNQIDVKLILRDENLEIMDGYLTNGGRSIPKLIALDSSTLEVIGTWGPRPETAQVMVSEFKKIENGDYSEIDKLRQILNHPFIEQATQSHYAKPAPSWGKCLEISCSS